MPARLVGLYALRCMERDGEVYGYSLADRISARTGGAWRPGPGAVYPALQRLVERGLAVASSSGRRREYRITSRGRRLLRQVRENRSTPSGSGPDLGLLWAEIVGASDIATYLLHRLRRSIDGIEVYLDQEPNARVRGQPLREDAIAELHAAERRFGHRPRPAPRPRVGPRRRT
jgi:DNA-binding PadR family transcriptional regulator